MQAFIKKQQSLESAYENLKNMVNAKTGVVSWVRQLPTPYAKNAFHIYVAKHPVVSAIKSYNSLLQNESSTSSAIGETPGMAKMLATCEAFERWSCVNQGDEKSITARYGDIASEAIHPAVLHGFSDEQYKNREQTNRIHPSGGGYIPEPLPADKEVRWCPVFDLVNKTRKYVLKASCFYGYNDQGVYYAIADSRGVAAGPSKEFCAWRAMLELIETDAGAIWNANQLSRPAIDIESFSNPYFQQLVDVHNDLGREVWALDISMDIEGIVVVAVISCDRKTGNVIKGFGTHPHAHKALEKALMECCQMLPNVVSPNGAPIDRKKNPALEASIEQAVHFSPSPYLKVKTSTDYPSEAVIKTIYELVQALQKQGITPLFQNVSRPEIGLCVMRVFAPGMRSWFPRTREGRLYDVPLRLKLKPQRLTENALFDIPIEI